jgi:predicted nucleotidyltransferase
MQLPKININEADLQEILKDYAVEELYLFGSILREDFTKESDVDVLISFKENSNYSLFDIMDLREKLEHYFNKKVDLIEKDGIKNPYRRKEILSTARRIYAN